MLKCIRMLVRYLGKTGKPFGIFGACHHVVYKKYFSFNSTDEDIEKRFNEYLPNSPFFTEGNPNKYITWFKSETFDEMIKNLIPLMSILEKYEVPFDIVQTNYIGKVIYEDKYQVAV